MAIAIESVGLAESALESFRPRVRGAIITPESDTYESARALYNSMQDRRPALIVQAQDAADVAATVSFAREVGLPLAVRGGGHNVAGLGSVDDGIVVDLSQM